MGLDAIIRSAVSIANSVTSDLQDTVTVRHWVGQNDQGAPIYETASYPALVEHEQRKVTNFDGEEVVTDTTVTVLQPIAAPAGSASSGVVGLGVVGEATVGLGIGDDRVRDPVDARDVVILPDGTTGAIQAERGLVDPSTSEPYMHEIFLSGGA